MLVRGAWPQGSGMLLSWHVCIALAVSMLRGRINAAGRTATVWCSLPCHTSHKAFTSCSVMDCPCKHKQACAWKQVASCLGSRVRVVGARLRLTSRGRGSRPGLMHTWGYDLAVHQVDALSSLQWPAGVFLPGQTCAGQRCVRVPRRRLCGIGGRRPPRAHVAHLNAGVLFHSAGPQG